MNHVRNWRASELLVVYSADTQPKLGSFPPSQVPLCAHSALLEPTPTPVRVLYHTQMIC
jgi:hypothetical protein